MEEIPRHFDYPQTIRSYNVDHRLRLRPSAFMEFAQQMAYDGAEPLGFGYSVVNPLGLAWILARMHFHYERTPKRGEDVTLQTWHKGMGPLFFRRDFRILGPDGLVSMTGTSEWVIMSIADRRMVRPSAISDILPLGPQSEECAIEQSAPKVTVPRGLTLEKAGEHTVVYSDIDDNGHTNNTRYVSWAMDCLDLDFVGSHDVSDVYINFNREAMPGETVELMHACDGADHYIEGKTGGAQVFITRIIFKTDTI